MNDMKTSFVEVTQSKASLLYKEIAHFYEYVNKNGGTQEQFDQITSPIRSLLEELYEEEMPVSRLLDQSDLVVRLEGKNLRTNNPSVNLIAQEFGLITKEVTNIVKAISSIGRQTKISKIDLGLTSIARGSIMLGFVVPEGPDNLLGKEDPIYRATKEAVRAIGSVARIVSIEDDLQGIEKEIIDPAIRDSTLVALKKITAHHKDVENVSIGTRENDTNSFSEISRSKSMNIKKYLKTPVRSERVETIKGTIREVDLDARRFEVRFISQYKVSSVRCVFNEQFDDQATSWLNKKVSVKGPVEFKGEIPRLMQLEKIDLR